MAPSKDEVKHAFLATAGIMTLLLLLASPSFALSIVGSKHDFSTSGTFSTPFAGKYYVGTDSDGFPMPIDEVCVFCHTPHGASKSVPGLANAPLWNRTNSPYNPPASYTYAMYSSATFSGAASISTTPTGISMMCMSCHDGVTSLAVNTLLNPPGDIDPGAITVDPAIGDPGAIGNVFKGQVFIGWGPNLGNIYPGGPSTVVNLSNDHPVSFEWPTGMSLKLNDPASIDSRLRLFGSTGRRMECATCHQVHDPLYAPFLAMPNDGSNMCRSCHIK